MKKVLTKPYTFTLVVVLILSFAGVAFAAENNPFATVPANHWAYSAISQLVKAGLIDGYSDGDFKGDRPVTRYEMAALTAKALTNQKKANSENEELIKKLTQEFSNELEKLGVRIKKLEDKVKDLQDRVGNIRFSGNIYSRYDNQRINGENVTGQYNNTYLNKNGIYNSKNSRSIWCFELDGQAKINDQGWQGNVALLGVRDWNGISQANEDTNGNFDIARVNITGPLGRGQLEVGRDKYTTIYGLVNNSYSTGAKYGINVNKAKINFMYVKPDHAWYNSYNDTGNSYMDDRNVATTYWNPGASSTTGTTTYAGYTGIRIGALDFKYPLSKISNFYGAFYHTQSQQDGITTGNLWEIAFDTQLTAKLLFKANYARSSADDNNELYYASLTYNKSDMSKAGSWDFTTEYVYAGYKAFINTSTDINDTLAGEKGYDLVFKFVPAQNVVWYTRWLAARTISNSVNVNERWIRSQVTFYY
jgi:hypothetical protein